MLVITFGSLLSLRLLLPGLGAGGSFLYKPLHFLPSPLLVHWAHGKYSVSVDEQ